MSNGRDVISLLDSDLLEYSATFDQAGQKVNAWRALCNLHERMALLELHSKRMATRHPAMAEQIEAVGAGLSQLCQDLEKVVEQTSPEAGQFTVTNATSEDEPVRPPLEAETVARICAAFSESSEPLELPLNTTEITPILYGFHAMENIGRWSGPSTTSMIALPLEALRNAGVARIRLCLKFTSSYGIQTVKILFGRDLVEYAEAVSVSGEDIVIDLDKIDKPADRIVLSMKRTHRHGKDPRQLGVMLEKLVLEHAREN